MSLPRILIALSVLALIVSLNVSFGSLFAQAANSGRSTLVGSAPTWANSKNYQSAANPTIDVGFRVYLGWNNPSAVEALAQAVSDPKSPSYGQYLTPQQFRQQFAPSQSQVGAVQSWLKSPGFSVEYTPMNTHYVSAAGTLPFAPCGYTPQQIKGAYGISGYDGSGQTVAIIDAYAAPTIVQDTNQWSINRGLPTLTANQLVQVVAPGTYNHPEKGLFQDPQGWYGEETLDVEAVHGMAPAATIVFVGAPNNFQDLDAALNHVVDRHLASIVTNSYGFNTEILPAGYIKPQEDTILQGVIEGIGIYFSSGDNSDESLVQGYATTDWPASSPFVTAVGGTSLAVGPSNNYLFETAWGTTTSSWTGTTWSPTPPGPWLYGPGGGASRGFAEPSYQAGMVPSSVFQAQGRTGRAVPDISAVGDPNTGYLIGEPQTFPNGAVAYSEYRIGGTSLSSPLVAGFMALVDQAAGHTHGFANPLFYRLAGSAAFTDIVSPSSTVAVVRANYVNNIDASAAVVYRL